MRHKASEKPFSSNISETHIRKRFRFQKELLQILRLTCYTSVCKYEITEVIWKFKAMFYADFDEVI